MMRPGILFDTINPEPVQHRWVPDTSKAAHREAVAEGRIDARAEEVLAWLHDMTHTLDGIRPVTSAELAGPHADLRLILHVRRGLSDLHKSGLVTKGLDRKCQVTGRTCNTWKLASR